MDIDFRTTTSFYKHYDINPKNFFVISQGGTRSGKTYSILQCLIIQCILNPNKNIIISIVAETAGHLSKGAIRDFKDIMIQGNIWDERAWNRSTSIYTLFGNTIEFFSVDNVGKARGPSRDYLLINEGDRINWDTAIQLINRTKKRVYIDFNPVYEFWAHTKLMANEEFNNRLEYIHTTYKDNEALDKNIVNNILAIAKKDKNYKRVYVDGEIGILENVIFPDIQLVEEIPEEIKEKSKKQWFGIDWGYSNDPASLNQIFIIGDSRTPVQEIWIDEILYDIGFPNRVLSKKIKENIIKDYVAICDSSEPKSRDDLRSWGININSVEKGPGSVNFGIQLMQQCKIFVTHKSVNTIKEFRNYTWAKDRHSEVKRDGKGKPIPIDFWNHSIDNIRYVAMTVNDSKYTQKTMRKRKIGFTAV